MPATAIAIGVTVLAASLTAGGGIAAALISTLIVAGATLATQALSRSQKPRAENLQDRTIMVREGLVSRRIPYGRVRLGGVWVYAETQRGNLDLWMILVLCDGPINRYERVFFDETEIFFDDNGNAQNEYTNLAFISYHDGSERDSEIRACRFDDLNNKFFDDINDVAADEMVRFFAGNGVLPTGVEEGVDYFTFNVDNMGGFQVSRRLGGPAIPITTGDGVNPIQYQIMREADKHLVSASERWNSDNRLRGIAYVAIRLTYQSFRFRDGVPNITFTIQGRNDIPDAFGQNPAYRANSALCLAHYLTTPTVGLGIPRDQIDEEMLQISANVCDEEVLLRQRGDFTVNTAIDLLVSEGHGLITGLSVRLSTTGTLPTPLEEGREYIVKRDTLDAFQLLNDHGEQAISIIDIGSGIHSFQGFERRYESNGIVTLQDNPESNIEEFTESLSGNLTFSEGKYKIIAGYYRIPNFTITQDMIIDTVNLITRTARRDKTNRVKGTFVSESSNWEPADFPAQEIVEFQELDREILTKDLELFLVSSPYQAQRISRIELFKSRRYTRQLTLRCSIECLRCVAGQTVFLDLPRFNIQGVAFEITENAIGTDERGAWFIDLVLKETNPGVYAWNPLEDQRPFDLEAILTQNVEPIFTGEIQPTSNVMSLTAVGTAVGEIAELKPLKTTAVGYQQVTMSTDDIRAYSGHAANDGEDLLLILSGQIQIEAFDDITTSDTLVYIIAGNEEEVGRYTTDTTQLSAMASTINVSSILRIEHDISEGEFGFAIVSI